jgi:hypothetical protein
MIEFQNLKQLEDAVENKTIPVEIAEELLEALCWDDVPAVGVKERFDYFKTEEPEHYDSPDYFDLTLGGQPSVCETVEDLEEIEGITGKCTESVQSWDVARYLKDDPSSEWAMLLLCTSNAGGTSYFIPRKLWADALIEQHILETDGYWKNANKQTN